jgi:hypothetical protein
MTLRIGEDVTLRGSILTMEGNVGDTGRPATILRPDDELFVYPSEMVAGAGTPVRTATNGVDRWTLGTGDSLLWTVRMPSWWGGFNSNVLWVKEALGTGNVALQLSYRLTYFADANAFSAKTPVAAVIAPAPANPIGNRGYTADLCGVDGVATPPGGFVGDPTIMHLELTRPVTGDTYVGDIGICVTGIIREGRWT